MALTKDDYKKGKIRMGQVKAAYTRTAKSLSNQLAAMEALFRRKDEDSDNWPEATAKSTAESVQKLKGQAEQAIEEIELAGNALTNVILQMDPNDGTDDLQ